MLKLLIVDDEPIIRNGIRGIINWAEYGYEICGEAEDGASAIKAITALKPDLVLLDLHLPGFSGLEVIKKIRAETSNNNIHFLIISGYAEFEYAQEAINLEVAGYITKPIDENILLEKIIIIAGKIKAAKIKVQTKSPIAQSEERRQSQFTEIIESRYDKDTPFYFSGEYVQAVFVSTENGRTQAVRNFFQKDICHVFSYREYVVFLFEDTPETAVKRLLENLYDSSGKSPSHVAITLGSRCKEEKKSPGNGIRKTCGEAETLMEEVFFYRNKKYISPNDIQNNEITRTLTIDKEAKKLSACIQVIDHEKIKSFFRELEIIFFNSGNNPREIRQKCMELMIEVRSDIAKKFPPLKDMIGTGKEIFDAIMNLRYLGEIIETMTEACLRISEDLPLLSADSSFQRIISYVKNNYNEDLKLETLGQLFNYNCAYLGKRFKEYTGKSFHTYLDTLRVDTAKKLLITTAMKVYEISSAVGYTNTDYFYSKFKKYTGESPLVYKKYGTNNTEKKHGLS